MSALTGEKLERQAAAIASAMTLILEPGQVVEIRSLSPWRTRVFATAAGGEIGRLAEFAARLSGETKGVYYTPNPMRTTHGSGTGGAANDVDIAKRNWLLIDVDPVRGKGENATDAERAEAWKVADAIRDTLAAREFAGLIVCDSGNGYHVMVPVDLPNNEEVRGQAKHFLASLDERFSTKAAKVDTAPHNAARIWKLPATLAAKGEPTADRPHRWTRVLWHDGHAPREAAEGNNARLAVLLKQWPIPREPKSDPRRYIETAIDRECGKLARLSADSHCRNETLNKAAFNLGQLVGGGAIDRGTVEESLRHAAKGCGLPDGETETTIRSGINAGMKKPRTVPVVVNVPDSAAGNSTQTTDVGVGEVVEWDEPVPVGDAVDTSVFPVDVFPTGLQMFIREASWALNVPVDYLGLSMLGVAGGAIGNSRRLRIKNSYHQSAAIYGVFVARPGTKKSSTLAKAVAPLRDAEARYEAEFRLQKEAWEEAGCQGSPPVCRRVLTGGGTTEGIVRRLVTNPRGLTLATDELSGLIGGMNQYKEGGKGNDRQFYLSAWDQQTYRAERVDEGRSVVVARPFISIIGAIQPDILPTLRGEHDKRGKGPPDDGFFDRFLVAYPPEPKAIGETWADISDSTLRLWDEAVTELLRLYPDNDGKPQLVGMGSRARIEYQAYTQEDADEVNSAGFDDGLRGPWSKLMGYFGRFILILHCLDQACEGVDDWEVGGGIVERAVKLTRYFKSQARRAAGLIEQDHRAKTAEHVLEWMKSRETQEPVRHRSILRNLRPIKSSEHLASVMNYLADLGHVEIIEDDQPRATVGASRQVSAQCRRVSSRSYLLNPKSLMSEIALSVGASAQLREKKESDIPVYDTIENAPTRRHLDANPCEEAF